MVISSGCSYQHTGLEKSDNVRERAMFDLWNSREFFHENTQSILRLPGFLRHAIQLGAYYCPCTMPSSLSTTFVFGIFLPRCVANVLLEYVGVLCRSLDVSL